MNPKDEMYINRYKLDKNRYIETIRLRHEMFSDAWLCEGERKKFITSFNAKENGWLDMIKEKIMQAVPA